MQQRSISGSVSCCSEVSLENRDSIATFAHRNPCDKATVLSILIIKHIHITQDKQLIHTRLFTQNSYTESWCRHLFLK